MRDFPAALVCPIDKTPLRREGSYLLSTAGRAYPVVDDVPVMLVGGTKATIGLLDASIAVARRAASSGKLDIDDLLSTVGVNDAERAQAKRQLASPSGDEPDPVVSALIGATAGIAYKNQIGKLKRIPIPVIPPEIEGRLGETVLDVGCSWGRWSMAAARPGRQVVGLDPSLGAVLAARRLARERGVPFFGVVGDARQMPFAERSFDGIISYSVLQHFSGTDLAGAVGECARVLRPDGTSAIQMASRNGLRSLFHVARRRFREPQGFDVRYWRPGELLATFGAIGPSRLQVDCFLGLGLQASDLDLASGTARRAIEASEWIKRHVDVTARATRFADSVWVLSTRRPPGGRTPSA